MRHSRRNFLATTTALGAAPLLLPDPLRRLLPSAAAQARTVFRHGVASGDPLSDRVILWTRISGTTPAARPGVRWEIARDEAFRQIAGRGELFTDAARDFTVKVDVPHLDPGTRYFYRFELPKVRQQAELLSSLDATTLETAEGWF